MLDSITLSAAFVCNDRLDVIGSNALGRALHSPMFEIATSVDGVANFARFHFLDEASRDFHVDWESGAAATVVLLRAEAGRDPQDKALRELIGELSTASPEFSGFWAAHDIRIRHEGTKRLQHPQVGLVELTYQSVFLPAGTRTRNDPPSTRPNRAAPMRRGCGCSAAVRRPRARARRRSTPTVFLTGQRLRWQRGQKCEERIMNAAPVIGVFFKAGEA